MDGKPLVLSDQQWGIIAILSAAIVALIVVIVLMSSSANPLVVKPQPSPSPSPPTQAVPIVVPALPTGVPPGLDTLINSRWEPAVVILDNQVGPQFSSVLAGAINFWEAAAVPVRVIQSYGGAPACDADSDPPVGTVVICMHTTNTTINLDGSCTVPGPNGCLPDDGDTEIYGSRVASNGCVPPKCPAISGVIWLKGGLSAVREQKVVDHELGHVFGIDRDTTDGYSIMNPHATGTQVTPIDRQTIDWLYSPS